MVVIQIAFFLNTESYLLVKLWTASIIKYWFIFFLEYLISTASKFRFIFKIGLQLLTDAFSMVF